jgi:hypothetical protein
MASGGKKKTTMAKLTRESKVRERRADKQARKDARKLMATEQADAPTDALSGADGGSAQPDTEESAERPDLVAGVS